VHHLPHMHVLDQDPSHPTASSSTLHPSPSHH
jgi:hypothetical protein